MITPSAHTYYLTSRRRWANRDAIERGPVENRWEVPIFSGFLFLR